MSFTIILIFHFHVHDLFETSKVKTIDTNYNIFHFY